MSSLNLRLPDELHNRLRLAAARERRSLHAHILWLLDKELPSLPLLQADLPKDH